VFYEFKFYVELGGLRSRHIRIFSGAEEIMSTRSLRVKNPATFLSNCLRRRPWPWLRPCRKSPSALMPPSSPSDPWPAARRRPCRRRSGSCQRIHQVDDVAGIGRSYRLALALLGSAARRVRFRSGPSNLPALTACTGEMRGLSPNSQ
jgi:hypothetical protein